MEATSQECSSIKATAGDYAEILDVSSTSVKEVPAWETIDSVMTRLDEFYGMMELVRIDSTRMTDNILHNFRVERDRLQLVYRKIDELERFIEIVRQNCNDVEKCLKEAGAEYGIMNSLKKALVGFHIPFGEGKAEKLKNKQEKKDYCPPTVFKTDDYFSSL